MQFKVFFVLLFCCSTLAIPVLNTVSSVDKIQRFTDRADGTLTSFSSSLRERAPQSDIQTAINMCQNAQCHYLGGSDQKSAWKVDLSMSHDAIFVLKVIRDGRPGYLIAQELHNLERVQHLVEWGAITNDKRTVYYILMHYMGMTYREYLKKHPGLDRAGYFLKLLNEAEKEYKAKGMDHHDLRPENLVFDEHPTSRNPDVELIDWEMATDTWKVTPTRLDDEELMKYNKDIEDNQMGKYRSKNKTT